MIIDNFLQFTGGTTGVGNSDGATDTPLTGSAEVSSQIVDLGNGATTSGGAIPTSANGGGARDIGIGDDPALKILVEVTTAMTAGNTIQIALQGAPDSGTGTEGTYATFTTGPAVTTAGIGARLLEQDMPRPPLGLANAKIPRFLRLSYILTNTDNVVGKIRGALVLNRHDQPQAAAGVLSGYPAGINVAN